MASLKMYKVRRKKDGLFAKKNSGYGGVHWSKTGTLWRTPAHLKMAFKNSLKFVSVGKSTIEIVVFELKETGTVKLEKL